MIGKIKGTLSEIAGNVGLIETPSGLSYQVYLTPVVLATKKTGQKIELYTYLQVRDDAFVLFGFETRREYELLVMLLTASGVGPKTAFPVVSFSKFEELREAVRHNNVDYFTRVPGLGKKTSMKIILELSARLDSDFDLEKMFLSENDKTVIDALISLGFKTGEAHATLSKIPRELGIEDKIKFALKTKKL